MSSILGVPNRDEVSQHTYERLEPFIKQFSSSNEVQGIGLRHFILRLRPDATEVSIDLIQV